MNRSHTFAAILLAVVALAAAGCGDPEWKKYSKPMAAWHEPEVLLLRSQPYDRLYVEIDTVEGTDPEEHGLAGLKAALRDHCDKPGGTQFVQGQPIPLAQAKGLHPHVLGLTQMSGPPESPAGKDRAAYVYVLFFDSRRMGLPKPVRPHTSAYFPAVFVDVAWKRAFGNHIEERMARHEAGHLLGLCKNADHGDGAHCTNDKCIMGPVVVSISRWLIGAQPREQTFCQDCLADMERTRTSSDPPRMQFRGPVLVRQEDGYWVGTLPGLVILDFGPPGEFDWRRDLMPHLPNAIEYIRTNGLQRGQSLRVCNTKKLPSHGAPLRRAASDPHPHVADMARERLKKLNATSAPAAATQPATASQPAGNGAQR